jgi:hypothetical protein
MPYTNTLPAHQAELRLSVRLFGSGFRLSWAFLALITIVLEIMPIPLMPRLPFYAYCGVKGILFALFGYLTPLTYWRFDVLNRGIAFAIVSACVVESLQGLVGHGHSFHFYELCGKLFLVFFGFTCALLARYDKEISFGAFRIQLTVEKHS